MADRHRKVAVLSLYRLKPKSSSIQENDVIFLRRALKVTVYVTAQSLGILDFAAYKCDMNPTLNVAQLDTQPLGFCPECERKVWWLSDAEPLQRYDTLIEYATVHQLEAERKLWSDATEAIRTGTSRDSSSK
jgi:hypothetical protein